MTLQEKELTIRSWPFPWPELLALRLGSMTHRMKMIEQSGHGALIKEYESDVDRLLREHHAEQLPVRMFGSLDEAQAASALNNGRRMVYVIVPKSPLTDEHDRKIAAGLED